MTIEVKICGIKTEEALNSAVNNGAELVGFVFFEKSPRNISLFDAMELCRKSKGMVERVGLLVDPENTYISEVLDKVGIDTIQLHGAESPERVKEIKTRFKLPIIKSCPISCEEDLRLARTYETIADRLLFDAKAHSGEPCPGGNARAFDWRLLAGRHWSCPWILAGGLTCQNVAKAIDISGAKGVDVSSGVENCHGNKSPKKIEEFLHGVKNLC